MDSHATRMVESARELLRNSGYCVENLWHIRDVHFMCEQNDLPRVTDAEAMEVFKLAHDQFDGDVGLSWPQLEKALNTYLLRKALLEGLCKTSVA